MSLKTELSEKLNSIAEMPENEFDRMISANISEISHMNESQLSDIYMLRRRAAYLCKMIPYKKEEIEILVINGEVGADSKAAQLFDCFNTLDFIFSKVNGEKF